MNRNANIMLMVQGKINSSQLQIQILILNTRDKTQEFMNLQPGQLINHQNLQQCLQPRPRVAFTYQKNQPHTLVLPYNPQLEFMAGNPSKNYMSKPEAVNLQTPKKACNKENNNDSSARKYDATYIHHPQVPMLEKKNISIGSPRNLQNISNCPSMVKKNSSPNLMKFPPVSPKVQPKKSHNRCPSFISQKSKLQENSRNDITEQQPQNGYKNLNNCKCGKPATHMVQNTEQKCCSKCGIGKMIKGEKLQPYVSPVSILIQKPQSKVHSKKQVPDLSKFLKSIVEEKSNIQKFYKQNLQKEDHNIINFYKQRKLELKSHYEKIKSAIKQSIEQDLKQIQILQQEQMCEWRISVASLEEDINKLSKIESQLKNQEVQNQQNPIKPQQFEQYKQIANKNRSELFGRTSKYELVAEADTMNISGISNTTSHNVSVLNKTIVLNNFTVNGQVYKPDIYRMINATKTCSGRPSELTNTLFPSSIWSAATQSPILSPRVMQYEQFPTKQIYKKQNAPEKSLLFSFEGKKK